MTQAAKSNKQLLAVLAVVSVLAICVILVFSLRDNSGVTTIGAIVPLTGDAGSFGQNTVRGIELAIADAEKSGLIEPGHFRVVAEDSKGEPGPAVSAARKLLDSDGAVVLVGDVTSAATHALIPVVTDAAIPLISPSASDPALSGASPFFARVWPSDDYEASVLAEYVESKGFHRVAVVYANTDYGIAMLEEFRRSVGESNIALAVPVDRESLNLRPVVQRLANAEPDSLLGILYPEDWARFLQQVQEAGLTVPVLATATFEDPTLLELSNSDGVVFASPRPDDVGSATKASFAASYESMFNEAPGVLSDTGYDAAMILIRAIVEAGSDDSTTVTEFIRSLKNYEGVSGNMSFDDQGDVKKPYGLRIVADGEFQWQE